MTEAATPSRATVARAADWFVRLQSNPDAQTLRDWTHWVEADPAHAVVWQRFAAMHEALPDGRRASDQAAIHAVQHGTRWQSRRSHLKLLLSTAAVGIAGTSGYRHASEAGWMAEYRTSIGEQRSLRVGSADIPLMLNTDTAVDVIDSGHYTDIRLHAGELLLDGVGLPADSGLRIVTRHATLEPADARLVVRTLRGDARHHTVAAQSHGITHITSHQRLSGTLAAGQALHIGANAITAAPGPAEREFAWTQGVLVAEDTRLDAFLSELGRYRQGIVRCAPTLAHRRVTGTFRIRDTDRVLTALAESLHVRLEYRTRYWVTMVAA